MATILAAQSTDKMINTITPALFARYPDTTHLARASTEELEPLIFKSGFYRSKARHLVGMARAVVERHGGRIPETMEALVALPGVARKTANVVLGSALGKNVGVVVDTHVTRLSARLGLTTHTDPVDIEQDLMRLLPREAWTMFAHRLIWHGRRVCMAKAPACEHCLLAPRCPSAGQVQLGAAKAATATSTTRRPTATAARAPKPTAARAPKPTAARAPKPTAARAPKPTAARAPKPTAARAPKPTAARAPKPTAARAPKPTAARAPKPTAARAPKPTAANTPKPTAARPRSRS